MHKVMLMYGPKSEAEVYHLLDGYVGCQHTSSIIGLLSLDGRPAQDGLWDLVLDELNQLSPMTTANPVVAFIHADELKEWTSYNNAYWIDAFITYEFVDETKTKLMRIYIPNRSSQTGDWAVIGGRWSGMLIPKSEGVAAEYSHEAFSDPPRKEDGFNCLKFGEVDWDKMGVQWRINVNSLVEFTEENSIRTMEAIFEEKYGEQYRALEDDFKLAFMQNVRWEIYRAFYDQINFKSGQTDIGLYELQYLGYPRDKLERLNAVFKYLVHGVFVDGKCYDVEPSHIPGCTLDEIIAIGERLRDTDPETVVTIIDCHY